MKNINNKGFTLVELLAVLIIFIIVIIIAVNTVKRSVDKTIDNSTKVNAMTLIKAVNDNATTSRITRKFKDGSYSASQIFDMGVSISGTKPDSGYIVIEQGIVTLSCLQYGKYYVNYINNEYSDPKKGSCPMFEAEVTEFAYTGDVQTFTVSKTGNYLLKVWGAQGGSGTETRGGYGAYSVIKLDLHKDDKLYINVGGQGIGGTTSSAGYNGGGTANHAGAYIRGGGGGATSIATVSGTLSSLESSKDSILIVAGGGGGGAYYNAGNRGDGGDAGGFIGNAGTNYSSGQLVGQGGTQTSGGTGINAGSFGQGANRTDGNSYGGSGGGGGYYGGGNSENTAGAGGGSGFINTTLGTDARMVCYECQESSAVTTKTISTTCVSETPTENCAKKGNGYVTISFLL